MNWLYRANWGFLCAGLFQYRGRGPRREEFPISAVIQRVIVGVKIGVGARHARSSSAESSSAPHLQHFPIECYRTVRSGKSITQFQNSSKNSFVSISLSGDNPVFLCGAQCKSCFLFTYHFFHIAKNFLLLILKNFHPFYQSSCGSWKPGKVMELKIQTKI